MICFELVSLQSLFFFLEDVVVETIKLIMLQFILGNIKLVPEGLFQKPKETVDQLVNRRTSVKGQQLILSTKDVSILEFVGDLANVGYVLVDAFYKMRSSMQGKDYPVVRFVFADSIHQEGEFAKHRQCAMDALLQLCRDAWTMEAYLNPYFCEGLPVEGLHTVSVNMAHRNPDATAPKLFLRTQNDDIAVVAVV